MTTSFGSHSTTDDVLTDIDLSGTHVLVTGVSSGLGLETACELTSLTSVRAAADALVSRCEAFDVVIANAGVMNCPFGRTTDGFETHFGTNHLGHFVLVNRIAPLIRDGGRDITLTSLAHHVSDVDLDDPGFEAKPYSPFSAYGRSKTATILFAVELDRRLRSRAVRGIAVQPGGIRTPLLRHTTPEVIMQEMLQQVHVQPRTDGSQGDQPAVKTVEQGSATTVWAAFVAAAEDVGGRYCEDCHVAEVTASGNDGVRAYAVDPKRARALWAKSEDLVGERF